MTKDSKDYYAVLGVKQDASPDEIKQAYHSLALKFHPDKNDAADAHERFVEIGEAYAVLSDDKRRQEYDGRLDGTSYGNISFSQFNGCNSYCYYDPSMNCYCYHIYGNKTADTRYHIAVTLEEILHGLHKKFRVKRQVWNQESRKLMPEYKTLELDVNPGWTTGTRVTFAKVGDCFPGSVAGDVIFILEEKQHAVFTRDGADIKCKMSVDLRAALVGTTLHVPSLEGPTIPLTITNVIKPGSVRRIQGRGLPNRKNGNLRGDIIVSFDVKFPDDLSDAVKSKLENLL